MYVGDHRRREGRKGIPAPKSEWSLIVCVRACVRACIVMIVCRILCKLLYAHMYVYCQRCNIEFVSAPVWCVCVHLCMCALCDGACLSVSSPFATGTRHVLCQPARSPQPSLLQGSVPQPGQVWWQVKCLFVATNVFPMSCNLYTHNASYSNVRRLYPHPESICCFWNIGTSNSDLCNNPRFLRQCSRAITNHWKSLASCAPVLSHSGVHQCRWNNSMLIHWDDYVCSLAVGYRGRH